MRWGEASATKKNCSEPIAEDAQPLRECSMSSDSMPAAEAGPAGVAEAPTEVADHWQRVGSKVGTKKESFLEKLGFGYQRDLNQIGPSGRSAARFAWMHRFDAPRKLFSASSHCEVHSVLAFWGSARGKGAAKHNQRRKCNVHVLFNCGTVALEIPVLQIPQLHQLREIEILS